MQRLAQFRQIRIELAREAGHPEGDAGCAYVIIAARCR
jgi:hypothetical protein